MTPYIIHNPARTDRYDLLMEELSSQGITEYEIIPAEVSYKNTMSAINRSHKKAIGLAQERGLPNCLIAEDDLLFVCQGAYKRFLEVFQDISADYDLFLSGFYDSLPIPVTDRYAKLEGKLSGLHLYIVNSKFYNTFLNAEEIYNLDYWLSSPEHGKAISYSAYPMLCIQRDGWSDNVKANTDYNTGLRLRYKIWEGTN
jgi:hypothetical protein